MFFGDLLLGVLVHDGRGLLSNSIDERGKARLVESQGFKLSALEIADL